MGKFLNESPSGIWKDVWQTGHLIVACSCLLAKFACLSRHSRQNEWRHGKVLGLSLNTADTLLLSEDLWRVVAHPWSNIMRNLIRNAMNCCNEPWTFYFWVTVEILGRPLVDRYGLWQRGFYSGTFFTLQWSANTFVISEKICRYHGYPWISHRIGEVVIWARATIPFKIWAQKHSVPSFQLNFA